METGVREVKHGNMAGVDLPRDKRVEVALTYIYGIGLSLAQEIIAKAGVSPQTRVKDLTESRGYENPRDHRPGLQKLKEI